MLACRSTIMVKAFALVASGLLVFVRTVISQLPESVCPTNEVYADCVITCNDCVSKGDCEQFVCHPGCDCVEGYFRDRYGNCIPEHQCHENACPINEEYTDCINPCNDCIIRGRCRFLVCNPGCNCVADHHRNEYGVCIPKDLCPSPKTCAPDEEFYECIPTCRTTCENYNLNSPCLLYCKRGCFCKQGLVKNKQGVCIKPRDCPKKSCSINEVYSKCVLPCNSCISRGKCKVANCSPGCDCKPGFFRTDDGMCIPEEDCAKPSCGPYEEYSNCVIPCNSCSRRGKCDFSDCSPGCECQNGYYRNDAGVCIAEHLCPKYICGVNEEYTDCVNPCNTCIGQGSCPFAICNPGCDCQLGFFRNASGICILQDQCPTNVPRSCPVDEQYYLCMPDCKNTCKNAFNPDAACTKICTPGCFCEEGLVRNQIGDCVFPEECDDVECKPDEQFYPCMPVCAHTCETFNITSYTCTEICKPGCFCKEGFVRKSDGTCVRPENCYRERCKLDERHYDCMPDCRNTCENFNNPNLVCTAECRSGCFCQEGFLKRKDGRCVLPSVCDKSCNTDEQFYICKPDCRNTCENINNPTLTCPPVCNMGCFCKEGLVLRGDGRCVSVFECPALPPILGRRRHDDDDDNTTSTLPITSTVSTTSAKLTTTLKATELTTETTSTTVTTDTPSTTTPESPSTTEIQLTTKIVKKHPPKKPKRKKTHITTTRLPTLPPTEEPDPFEDPPILSRKHESNETNSPVQFIGLPDSNKEGLLTTTSDKVTESIMIPPLKKHPAKTPHRAKPKKLKHHPVTINPEIDAVHTSLGLNRKRRVKPIDITTIRIPVKRDINWHPDEVVTVTPPTDVSPDQSSLTNAFPLEVNSASTSRSTMTRTRNLKQKKSKPHEIEVSKATSTSTLLSSSNPEGDILLLSSREDGPSTSDVPPEVAGVLSTRTLTTLKSDNTDEEGSSIFPETTLSILGRNHLRRPRTKSPVRGTKKTRSPKVSTNTPSKRSTTASISFTDESIPTVMPTRKPTKKKNKPKRKQKPNQNVKARDEETTTDIPTTTSSLFVTENSDQFQSSGGKKLESFTTEKGSSDEDSEDPVTTKKTLKRFKRIENTESTNLEIHTTLPPFIRKKNFKKHKFNTMDLEKTTTMTLEKETNAKQKIPSKTSRSTSDTNVTESTTHSFSSTQSPPPESTLIRRKNVKTTQLKKAENTKITLSTSSQSPTDNSESSSEVSSTPEKKLPSNFNAANKKPKPSATKVQTQNHIEIETGSSEMKNSFDSVTQDTTNSPDSEEMTNTDAPKTFTIFSDESRNSERIPSEVTVTISSQNDDIVTTLQSDLTTFRTEKPLIKRLSSNRNKKRQLETTSMTLPTTKE